MTAAFEPDTTTIHTFLLSNIHAIVTTFDAHDPGIDDNGRYRCPCGWQGSETVWHIHLAEAIADQLTGQTVELP